MPEIDVRGTTLFYTDRGSGEPVVLVHGGISDYRTWTHQLEGIGEGYRTIAYSQRWHWPNEPISDGRTSTMDVHVADLEAFLTALTGPAHLVGNSWGAFCCLMLAHRRPDLVRSLTLEEPPIIPVLFGEPPRPARILAQLVRRPRVAIALLRFAATVLGPVQATFGRGDAEGAMVRFARGVLGADVYESLPELRKQQMRANLPEFAAEMRAKGGFVPFTESNVRAVRTPTLLLVGERSPIFLKRLTDVLEELLPDRRRVMIPGASHAMHEENPAATNAAIRAFLLERRAQRAA